MSRALSNQIRTLPTTTLYVGEERSVVFLSEQMGVKLNRGQDGIIRVLSVAKEGPGSKLARRGEINPGDIIREAAGVDLRRPLTNIMWSDTVALMKISPRPLHIIIAKELSERPPAVQEEFLKVGIESPKRRIRRPDPPNGYDPPSRAGGVEPVSTTLSEMNDMQDETATNSQALESNNLLVQFPRSPQANAESNISTANLLDGEQSDDDDTIENLAQINQNQTTPLVIEGENY